MSRQLLWVRRPKMAVVLSHLSSHLVVSFGISPVWCEVDWQDNPAKWQDKANKTASIFSFIAMIPIGLSISL